MSQHFLMSAAAKTLSVREVARMTEEEARWTFKSIRWPHGVHCPKCDNAAPYTYRTRPVWKCPACKLQFSLTAGTIFADRKMSMRDCLFAVVMFTNAAQGLSAMQLSRDMGVNYQTAFALLKKLRTLLHTAQQDIGKLSGTVEVDGAFFGGHLRYANKATGGRSARLVIDKRKERRSVVVARERGEGGRTRTLVCKHEHGSVPLVREVIAPGSEVHTDGAGAWGGFKEAFDHFAVEHKDAYAMGNVRTNLAESYFARLRRATAVHHRMSGKYLHLYAAEMAWREDVRRQSNGAQFSELLKLAAGTKERNERMRLPATAWLLIVAQNARLKELSPPEVKPEG